MSEINSPFRYPGGKFYARKLILECLVPHTYYIEPFAGGASIFFAKEKVAHNVLNDADPELINCYLTIRDNVEGLIALLNGIRATKENHGYYKNTYRPANDLERAFRWYYLNRISYSGIMNMQNCYWGYGDKYSMQPRNWPTHLRRCSEKLQGVSITCEDFEQVIAQAPIMLFFLSTLLISMLTRINSTLTASHYRIITAWHVYYISIVIGSVFYLLMTTILGYENSSIGVGKYWIENGITPLTVPMTRPERLLRKGSGIWGKRCLS